MGQSFSKVFGKINSLLGRFVFADWPEYPGQRRGYRLQNETSELSFLRDEDDKFSVILVNVADYFEKNKPYLRHDLKINDVARAVATNRNYLSKAINLRLAKNFNQLCNYYRVRHACSLYISRTSLKVFELCEMSGFNSNSAFLSAFNSYIGISPSKWCRNVKYRLQRRETVTVEDYIKPLVQTQKYK